MKTFKLYAVNYVDSESLKEEKSIRTHSRNKAIKIAQNLLKRDDVLYSQVETYEYNLNLEYYTFKTLKNYYK